MANNNQIIPISRSADPLRRIKGSPDRRRRAKIAIETQVERLGSKLNESFSNILDRDDISVAEDPASLAPERALVMEIVGSPTSFVRTAERVGLEWLAEEIAILRGVRSYFDPEVEADAEDEDEEDWSDFDDLMTIGNQEEELLEPDETPGRVYLGMPTIATFDRLRDLWTRYASGAPAPDGFSDWWAIFSHLHQIRPWAPEDRISEATRLRLRAERTRHPNDMVKVEVDLWYRGDPARRGQAVENFRSAVDDLGGSILDEQRIDDIRYHAALVELPAAAADAIIAISGPLAINDDIMSIRPQASFRFGLEALETHSAPPSPAWPETEQPSIAAMIDGYPVENHQRLAGRLDVIPLDVGESLAPVNTRFHGTAMASLILNGDLHDGGKPISRRLKVVPVLAPDAAGYESPPGDKLALGLIHRAVVELKEGTGGHEPSGPDVVLINHSICDEAGGFAGSMSAWARLLDHLSFKYGVLFVVSAGNIGEGFDLPDYASIQELRSATPEHRRAAIVRAIDAAKAGRTMLAPAESVNSLTVAAAHRDGSTEALPGNLSDPFGEFAGTNVNSGLGLGFGGSIKPDIMLPGGRQIVHPVVNPALKVHGREASNVYGQSVASPDPHGASLSLTRRSSGTSNAAALATRAGLLIADVLDASEGPSNHPWYRRRTAPCILKALIAHGADWGDVGRELLDTHIPSGSRIRQKENVSRFIGYGEVDHTRLIGENRYRVTLLGEDVIRKEGRHEYRIPLPDELSSSAEFRRVTLTLAWQSPISANSANYRKIGLQLVDAEGRSMMWEGAKRLSHQPPVTTARRGTLIHSVHTGTRAVPFAEGGNFVVNVQATSRHSHMSRIDIPYALAVSIEVAASVNADIYQSIRNRLQQRARATGR